MNHARGHHNTVTVTSKLESKERERSMLNISSESEGGGADAIVGSCLNMCPKSERLLREREGLLHRLEYLKVGPPHSFWPQQDNGNVGPTVPNSSRQGGKKGQRKVLPKADVNKTVKSFARSAAGQDKTLVDDLRPIHVLKKTVAYLCSEVLSNTELPFIVTYNFVFDRLRAVRQDLVIQRIENRDAILILETVVKFHIFSGYKLRNESIHNYDPHINHKHLVDCLRKLLNLYQINIYWEPSRAEFEALNCMVSPKSYDTISRAFAIKSKVKSNDLNRAIEMALAYQTHNYVRFFRRLTQLPLAVQIFCVVQHVNTMRSIAYQVMSVAYGVNTCKIPLTIVAAQLGYCDARCVHTDLGLLSVEIVRDEKEQGIKYAKFLKANRESIGTKSQDISSDINSTKLTYLVQDKSGKLTSELICPWQSISLAG